MLSYQMNIMNDQDHQHPRLIDKHGRMMDHQKCSPAVSHGLSTDGYLAI